MPELPPVASDRPLRPDQYVFVETHAWWLDTHGPHQHLAEHRLRQWIPADVDEEWMLDREITGAKRWIAGSAHQAVADGYDLRPVVPVGRFRARQGVFETGQDETGRNGTGHHAAGEGIGRTGENGRPCRSPTRRRGSWQAPTTEFLSRLPRDPVALTHRLREENTGSWFGPFAAGVTALRTCLVPAELRSALCAALACLPGVRTVQDVRNVDGVTCLALVHDAGHTCTELMLSPADGQFAGERDTVRTGSRSGLAVGTVISSTAVWTAVVDAAGIIPA